MEAYAVIQTGGKQYRVSAGNSLKIERLEGDIGATVALGSVLAVSDGQALKVGTPELAGATVTGQIVEHIRGPKLVAFKKKRRKGFRKTKGHRQELTLVKVAEIKG